MRTSRTNHTSQIMSMSAMKDSDRLELLKEIGGTKVGSALGYAFLVELVDMDHRAWGATWRRPKIGRTQLGVVCSR